MHISPVSHTRCIADVEVATTHEQYAASALHPPFQGVTGENVRKRKRTQRKCTQP